MFQAKDFQTKIKLISNTMRFSCLPVKLLSYNKRDIHPLYFHLDVDSVTTGASKYMSKIRYLKHPVVVVLTRYLLYYNIDFKNG